MREVWGTVRTLQRGGGEKRKPCQIIAIPVAWNIKGLSACMNSTCHFACMCTVVSPVGTHEPTLSHCCFTLSTINSNVSVSRSLPPSLSFSLHPRHTSSIVMFGQVQCVHTLGCRHCIEHLLMHAPFDSINWT